MTSLKRGQFLGHGQLVVWLATSNKPSLRVRWKLGVPRTVRVQEMHAGLQSAGLC